MNFDEEMKAKQAAKDKLCKDRVHKYMTKGITSAACKKCNHFKTVEISKVCDRFSREVLNTIRGAAIKAYTEWAALDDQEDTIMYPLEEAKRILDEAMKYGVKDTEALLNEVYELVAGVEIELTMVSITD